MERRGTGSDRSCLAALLNNKAIALHDAGQDQNAAELLTEAVRHQRAALEEEPLNEQYRTFLNNHYSSQVMVFLALDQWENAADAARSRCQLWKDRENERHESARQLTQVAAAIRAADQSSDHRKLADQLEAEAQAAMKPAPSPETNLKEDVRKDATPPADSPGS